MEKEGGGVKKVFVMEEWGIDGRLTGRSDGERKKGEEKGRDQRKGRRARP